MNENEENKKNLRKILVEDASASNDGPSDNKIPDDLSDEEMIDLFVEGLMEEKGIEPGDEPYKSDIFVDLKKQLMSEIDRSLIAELPDDKLDEFNKKVESGEQIDPAAVAQAVTDAKLDVSKIVLGTMARFKELYLNGGEAGEDGGE